MTGLRIPLSFAAFFIVAGAVNQVVTGILPLIAGAAAAYWLNQHLVRCSREQLQRTARNYSESWNVPYPVAYGCFRDTLQTFMVNFTGEPKRFHVSQEDESRGLITATLNWTEHLRGLFGDIGTNSVTVYLTVQIRSAGPTSNVSWSFGIDGLRTVEAEKAVISFNQQLRSCVLQNSGGGECVAQ